MTQLEKFCCGYVEVHNISVIKSFKSLKSLELCGITVDNLDFLNAFPDDIHLKICEIDIQQKDFDVMSLMSLTRFTDAFISDIKVNGNTVIEARDLEEELFLGLN